MRTQLTEIAITAAWARVRSGVVAHPVKRVMLRFGGTYLRGAS